MVTGGLTFFRNHSLTQTLWQVRYLVLLEICTSASSVFPALDNPPPRLPFPSLPTLCVLVLFHRNESKGSEEFCFRNWRSSLLKASVFSSNSFYGKPTSKKVLFFLLAPPVALCYTSFLQIKSNIKGR